MKFGLGKLRLVGGRAFQDSYVICACSLFAFILALAAPHIQPEDWSRQRTVFLAKHAISSMLRQANLPLQVEPPEERLGLALQTMNESPAEVAGLKKAMAQHAGVREVEDSSHRLLANVHHWGSIFAVELRLLRRGWVLRMNRLERFIDAPWVPGFGMLVASVFCLLSGARWLIMPVAAGIAQICLAALRRGQGYREIPVLWGEWPDAVYARLDELWLRLVFHNPAWSIGVVSVLLLLAYGLSRWAKFRARERSWREIAIMMIWVLASLAWWDATFRCSLPLGDIWVSGAGWMRISRTAASIAWGVSAVMVLRRHRKKDAA